MGEIRSLAVKAARGAGFDWGLAEEAGFAVEWLERRGMPGAAALSGYLTFRHYNALPTEIACPLTLGALISDTGDWQNHFPCACQQPMLLAPFLANVCGESRLQLEVLEIADPDYVRNEDDVHALMPRLQIDFSYTLFITSKGIHSPNEIMSLEAQHVAVSAASESDTIPESASLHGPTETRIPESRSLY